MRPFVNVFGQRFDHILILDGRENSFRANPQLYIEVDLKKKILCIKVFTIKRACQQRINL